MPAFAGMTPRGPSASRADGPCGAPPLGVEVSVHQRGDGERPEFQLDHDTDHPLAVMQRDGLAADLPRRLLALVPHE
jgi:hypothetical protein